MSDIMDTRQAQCVSEIPSTNNVYDGHQNKILCMMDTGYKYCVSWIQDICIYFVAWVPDVNKCVSWIPYVNIVYHGYRTNIVYRE